MMEGGRNVTLEIRKGDGWSPGVRPGVEIYQYEEGILLVDIVDAETLRLDPGAPGPRWWADRSPL